VAWLADEVGVVLMSLEAIVSRTEP